MTAAELEFIEVNPAGEADTCVIWLHGLGADGHDFAGIQRSLNWAATGRTRFIFPHAPVRPITINNGMLMRGWYDLYGWELQQRIDDTGIEQSVLAVQSLVQQQLEQGILPGRVVVAGFSQGGVIALEAASRFGTRLGGVIALSTYLPRPAMLPECSGQFPVFWGHGTEDPIVPVMLGEQAVAELQHKGFSVEWLVYPMQHSVCEQEIADIDVWLGRHL